MELEHIYLFKVLRHLPYPEGIAEFQKRQIVVDDCRSESGIHQQRREKRPIRHEGVLKIIVIPPIGGDKIQHMVHSGFREAKPLGAPVDDEA